MHNTTQYQKGFLTLLVFSFTKFSFCQLPFTKSDTISYVSARSNREKVPKKSNFNIEFTASVLPPAKITKDQGNYRLRSHLQSSYDFGFNYHYNLNKDWLISTGVHFILGRRNFLAFIPGPDMPGYSSDQGAPLIWDKEVWGAVKVPFLIEKKFSSKKIGLLSLKAGLGVRYSGFMLDESVGSAVIDSNNQVIDIFNSSFSVNNNKRPWVTFLAGISKLFILDNYNILSVGIQADISSIYFYKGNYAITIPGQPITSGTYKISGSSLGVSVAYTFTGTNKVLARKYIQ